MNLKLLSASLILIIIVLSGSANAQPSREEEFLYPFSPDGTLHIVSDKGTITIRTWDRPEVHILSTVTADEDTEAARELVDQTLIDIFATESRITIDFSRADMPEIESIWDVFNAIAVAMLPKPTIHYLITMPRTAALIIDDNKSLMDIYGLESWAKIRTGKGSIDIAAFKGRLEIETASGNAGIADLDGSLNVETESGTVKASFIRLEGNSIIETESGNVALFLPLEAAFDLDVKIGERGTLESDFPPPQPASKEFHINVNGGGPEISIESEKGRIALKKH